MFGFKLETLAASLQNSFRFCPHKPLEKGQRGIAVTVFEIRPSMLTLMTKVQSPTTWPCVQNQISTSMAGPVVASKHPMSCFTS